jgi:hypothetical protein
MPSLLIATVLKSALMIPFGRFTESSEVVSSATFTVHSCSCTTRRKPKMQAFLWFEQRMLSLSLHEVVDLPALISQR